MSTPHPPHDAEPAAAAAPAGAEVRVIAHSPGPWLWNEKNGSLHQAPGEGPYRYGPAVLSPSYEYESGTNVEVSDADAALIAAAPDLLEALNALLDACNYVANMHGGDLGQEIGPPAYAARTALSRARGEQP